VPLHEGNFAPGDYPPKTSELLLDMDKWIGQKSDERRSRVVVGIFEELLRYAKTGGVAPSVSAVYLQLTAERLLGDPIDLGIVEAGLDGIRHGNLPFPQIRNHGLVDVSLGF